MDQKRESVKKKRARGREFTQKETVMADENASQGMGGECKEDRVILALGEILTPLALVCSPDPIHLCQ